MGARSRWSTTARNRSGNSFKRRPKTRKHMKVVDSREITARTECNGIQARHPHQLRPLSPTRVGANREYKVPHFINTITFAARDFWPRRGASDEHTLQRSVRSEQRRLGQKGPPPGGLRRFSVLASLLLGHSPTSGDAPSSRLARTENRRNKRGRIYETGY